MNLKVRDVMTHRPVCLPADAAVSKAARLMRDQAIGDVLVLKDDRLFGVVTDRDIVIRAVAEARDADSTPLGTLCTSEPVTVRPEEDADEVVRLMREKAIRRVPVVEDGRPVGIVSLGDVALEREPASTLSMISGAPPNG
ncbi:CBS domain-containing protein [Sphaerisporangium album]|uniref:CBS domain-containing protein n=1 Tax=Sphaerisporangium album TaxID=509200 RepID=A0A367FS48_9ACTN|nr:CBS domain-containing protein [Sphaerisporangium album]RCG33121.1 CBS domain-containing protein [Sphaerisporangium album]